MTPADRFWSKVDRPSMWDCWTWKAKRADGYGRFWMPGGVEARAHRVAYELLVGPIPDGLTLDHLCRNKACVNPAHLEPVTSSENARRAAPFIERKRLTHCKRGHKFTPENIHWSSGRNGEPQRGCRACHVESMARRVRDRSEASTTPARVSSSGPVTDAPQFRKDIWI